jgi:hypothetical protein
VRPAAVGVYQSFTPSGGRKDHDALIARARETRPYKIVGPQASKPQAWNFHVANSYVLLLPSSHHLVSDGNQLSNKVWLGQQESFDSWSNNPPACVGNAKPNPRASCRIDIWHWGKTFDPMPRSDLGVDRLALERSV